MSVLLLILGLVLLAVVSSDVLVTTLTVRGGGFLTNRFSSWLWHGSTKLHRHNNNHRLLAAVGLFLILGMAVIWYLCTWVAWSLIFCSFSDAIVNSSNGEPASIWGRIYFVAYTITTLGRGDYQPSSTIWHLLTGLAAANGFFLVTLSIAYLFPVRRSCAAFLTTLKSDYIKPSKDNPPLMPLELLRKKGIPTLDDSTYGKAMKQIATRRKLLLALVDNDGWSWSATGSSLTTNRAKSLDDDEIVEDLTLG